MLLTDIAPNGGTVDDVTAPYNRVDELYQAGQRGPYHKDTSASIPCLEVPWQGNEGEYEAEKGKDGEERVGQVRGLHRDDVKPERGEYVRPRTSCECINASFGRGQSPFGQ